MQYAEIINLTVSDGLMILAAYLVGGISPGYLLVRMLRGIDIRTVGSGSLGARNVGRVLGRKGFYFALVADILKGALIVWLARELDFPPGVVGSVVVAVIVGHIWPLWLHFHGGKGIATSLGAFVALDYKILLMGGVVLLVTYMATRSFLVSWIATLVAMPLIAFSLGYPMYVVVPLFVSAAIVLYAHKENIKQAWHTSEHKG
ncbi:MAG: glycerol-3-phosphate 1-O-acyltransferase PlsY [Proteobacteria bacterium]|jgi:acyl phosphate:glycerol-3-phosphate acyltransferase|nr:glycerol-3-phosphate 1-O-acyltransferase PlsY [Pseudomonadota bacterium]